MFEIMFDILSNAKGVEIDDYEKEDEYQKGYIDFNSGYASLFSQ